MNRIYISDLLLVVCIILLICSLVREARLKERLALHEVLLTGPTACRLTMVVPTPRPNEIGYFIACEKKETEGR